MSASKRWRAGAAQEPPAARPQPLWTERAIRDLREIGDYIARDDAAAAERWVMALITTAEAAADAPLAGRMVPEMGRPDVREVLKKSYRIVYRIAGERLHILTVFEGHRRFPVDLDLDDEG